LFYSETAGTVRDQRRPIFLRPALSLVPFDIAGASDHPPGDAGSLAWAGFGSYWRWLSCNLLYGFIIVRLDRRELVWTAVTRVRPLT
jgi:hypothetical protein